MTLTTEMQDQIEGLKHVLTKRMKYSRHWSNVSIKVRSRYIEIKFFNSTKYDDPLGKTHFSSRKVAPLNKTTLSEELCRQKLKLKQDKKNKT